MNNTVRQLEIEVADLRARLADAEKARDEQAEAVRAMRDAVRAANAVSRCAEKKYGTWIISSTQVELCDKAVEKCMHNPIAAAAVKEASK